MVNKLLDKMMSDICSHEEVTLSTMVSDRLDKILQLYVRELDLEYIRLLNKKSSKSLLKELCKK